MPWITLKTLLCLVNFSNFPLPSQDLIKHLSNLNGESLFVQAQFSPAESSDNLQPFDGMSKWVWNSDIWFNHLFDPIWFPFIWLQMHRQGAWQKRMIITLEKKKKGFACSRFGNTRQKKNSEWLTWALSWKKTWESGCIRAVKLRAFQRGSMAGSCSGPAWPRQQTLDRVTFCYRSTWQFRARKSKWGAGRHSGPAFKLTRLKKMLGGQKE